MSDKTEVPISDVAAAKMSEELDAEISAETETKITDDSNKKILIDAVRNVSDEGDKTAIERTNQKILDDSVKKMSDESDRNISEEGVVLNMPDKKISEEVGTKSSDEAERNISGDSGRKRSAATDVECFDEAVVTKRLRVEDSLPTAGDPQGKDSVKDKVLREQTNSDTKTVTTKIMDDCKGLDLSVEGGCRIVKSENDKDGKSLDTTSERVKSEDSKGEFKNLVDCNGVKSETDSASHVARNIKSERSEKENCEDVVMLSDDEEADHRMDRKSSRAHHSAIMKKIRALQNELRNEEASLVLLKKLRQSQMAPEPPAPTPPVLPPQPMHRPPAQHSHSSHSQHTAPPPLVNRNQPIDRHKSHQNSGRSQQPSRAAPPPLIINPGQQRSNVQALPHHGRSLPQNVQRPNASARHIQQMPQQAVKAPPPPPVDTQTPAQRQAAAKQALRKQLEKTLLQIPPPKPPPPEMNFIPSLACPDFILLLGLEEVVNHMIDYQLIARGQKSPDERFVCTPFTCVQCGSDFTPVWKREKPGSKSVICELCVTTNQKKALKQEHTNRLKSAFVKALQQEQEIERMQATAPSPQPAPSTPQPPPPPHPVAPSNPPMISAASAAAAAANAAAAAAAVANFRPSAEQLRQHHSFLQQAQLRGQPLGLQAFSHRAPFPYNLPFANQQELQRQYLLDMIPRGNLSWKQ